MAPRRSQRATKPSLKKQEIDANQAALAPRAPRTRAPRQPTQPAATRPRAAAKGKSAKGSKKAQGSKKGRSARKAKNATQGNVVEAAHAEEADNNAEEAGDAGEEDNAEEADHVEEAGNNEEPLNAAAHATTADPADAEEVLPSVEPADFTDPIGPRGFAPPKKPLRLDDSDESEGTLNRRHTRSHRRVRPKPENKTFGIIFPKSREQEVHDAESEAESIMAYEAKTRGRPRATGTASTNGTKRKTDDDQDKEETAASPRPVAKKARATKTAKATGKNVINHAPTQRPHVFVCGEGSNGELGLGTAKNVIDVKRPRLNPLLSAASVGVVQVACGGMHGLALTRDGTVLSWGVNDGGALGRPTGEGPLQDLDQEDDDDASDSGLNPDEANPTAVTFPQGVVIVQVAAGDGISLALTDDGHVYGWGEFRGTQGEFGFWRDMSASHKTFEEHILDNKGEKIETKLRYELEGLIKRQVTPRLYTELSKITDIACGNNHCLARDTKGMVFTWGIGEQNQLGRRQIERIDTDLKRSLVPQPLRTGRISFTSIFCGADHSFAIDKKNQVHGWGFNGYGQLAEKDTKYFPDSDEMKEVPKEVIGPIIIHELTDNQNPIVKLAGGQKHSMAARQDGELLTWGLIPFSGVAPDLIPESALLYNQEPGSGKQALAIIEPIKVWGVDNVVHPGCGSEHTLAITAEGKAFAWGSGSVYQLGLGVGEDEPIPSMVDNTAVRNVKLNWASGGGQYSIFTAPAADDEDED